MLIIYGDGMMLNYMAAVISFSRVVWKGPGGALVCQSRRLTLARGEAGAATLTITDCK